ncbi:TonB-dependent receptor [Sphingomonas sp. KR1UV-12]|uniref:TonB-dependent receptor n=1 Tax=Sphingomonas aurea TaxID=3063994 RepID=A0ABT9EJD4_9SPHN|nr:TonB-dependent receptor [Sphingomonas sp. KR1UV-12]MDP1026945.1 TonB-dependent receptor [Sphingomonas sp. KR1UV-12]
MMGVVGCLAMLAQVAGAPPAEPIPAPAADPATTRSDRPTPSPETADTVTAPSGEAIAPAAQPAATAPPPGATGASDGRLVYDAAFFRAFSPATALEIVRRTPGFQLDVADQEVRGFGQAAGNFVINGQRPSAKSDTPATILQRIPANRVLRVEVGRGDLFGAEFAGRPQVLNLVLTDTGGVAGTVEGSVMRDYTGHLYPAGTASTLIRRGRSSLNLALGVVNERTTEEGFDRITTLPAGQQTEYRRKINRLVEPEGYVSGAYEFNGGTNDTAHLNGRLSLDRTALTQSNTVTPATGPVRDDRLTQRYKLTGYELGGDYTRPFLGGGLKLIGLVTRKARDDRDLSLLRVESDVVGGFAQSVDDHRDETVIRTVWNRSDLAGWSVELGVEGALNVLRSDVNLFEIAEGGGRTRIDLPVDQATVREYRGETFVNVGRLLSTRLRVDMGVTYEASRLTVSGDAAARRVLTFLKPRVTLDWRPGGKWHAQASVKRTVAQLQFEDFISVAELTNERVNGGNANLQPQRAWETLAFVERPILGDGLVRLEAGYNRIQLVQDRVPTPEGFDAPGNLGDGELYLLRGRIDAPLTPIGVKGGRATIYVSYVGTRVDDPYTGRGRPFSGTSPLLATASLRQDSRRFAWGVDLEAALPTAFYRLNEIDRSYSRAPYVTVFAEYRPTSRSTITIGLDNASGAPAFRRRTFYLPDRRTEEPSLLELRQRNRHIVPFVKVKHQFG